MLPSFSSCACGWGRAVQQQLLDVSADRMALLRVQSEQLSQRVNLHLALGGGFASPPPAATDSASRPQAGSSDEPLPVGR